MIRWPTKPLDEIATVIRGVSFDKSQVFDVPGENLVPILRAGNIQDTLLTNSDLLYVPRNLISSEQSLRKGDIAICMSSGSPAVVGKSAYAETDWSGSVGAFCAIVRFGELIHKRFGSYWFRSPAFLQWRNSKAKGANIQNLRKTELEQLVLPAPPLVKQEQIVKLLDEADALRKFRAQADRRAAALISALFHEMFGDPATNPKGWPISPIKDFAVKVRYGLGQPPEKDSKGVYLLRATNVKHGRISEVGLIRVRRDDVPVSRNAFLKTDDVLVVRSGAYTGDVARVGEKWAGSVAGYDLVISPGERFMGDFIAWFLLSDFVQKHYFSGLKLRAAQPHLNSAQVLETPFFCPPLPLQKQFAARVTEICAMENSQALNREKLDALFQSLSDRAFNGEL